MNGDERELFLEAVSTAHRERDPDGRVLPPAAWWDLAPDDRLKAFDVQVATREMERVLDPKGWNGTIRAVISRLR